MHTLKATTKERLEMLASCPLFQDLHAEELSALARVVSPREYDRGDMLFFQGDRADGFYIIVGGRVEIHRRAPNGRRQLLRVFGPGELCGEVPVFQGGSFPATATAAENVRALWVPGEKFLDVADRHGEILLEMLAVLSLRLRRFVNLIDDLSLKEVSARLAKHLLDLSVKTACDVVTIETTKTLLAGRLGTVSETLSRTLKKMQKRAVIEVRGRTVTILDRDALTALAAGVKL